MSVVFGGAGRDEKWKSPGVSHIPSRGRTPRAASPALRESFLSSQSHRPSSEAAWTEDNLSGQEEAKNHGLLGPGVGRKVLEARVPSSQLQQLGVYRSHQGAMSSWLTASHVGRA
ncbi:hypothetical protein LEMLEM_LOCUS8556 [Lemmus lemmus]